jgi:hypothetical protein
VERAGEGDRMKQAETSEANDDLKVSAMNVLPQITTQ